MLNATYTIALLVGSNIFMTLAWCGHLKFSTSHFTLFSVIAISWCVAFLVLLSSSSQLRRLHRKRWELRSLVVKSHAKDHIVKHFYHLYICSFLLRESATKSHHRLCIFGISSIFYIKK